MTTLVSRDIVSRLFKPLQWVIIFLLAYFSCMAASSSLFSAKVSERPNVGRAGIVL